FLVAVCGGSDRPHTAQAPTKRRDTTVTAQENTTGLPQAKFETLTRRIRALIRLAEDLAATPAEAATATPKPPPLLLKYNLDLARVRAMPQADEYIQQRVQLVVSRGPYVNAHRSLLAWLCKYNFCRMVFTSSTNRAALIGARHN